MTTPRWSRTIENLVQTIRNAKDPSVVLIGAGCSKSAGIPLASELIREVSQKFQAAYTSLPEADRQNYNKVMSELTIMERRNLLDHHIRAARINWAHLALAQLFATGKIDRVLTVNFDDLLVRACTMVGLFPAIYDLATADRFRPAHIAPRSVFYLNGQHTGFLTLNAENELKRHRKRLEEIVRDTGTKRTWVVIGYSGDADPLLDVLAKQEVFEGGLYWVGYDTTPSPNLRRKILTTGKYAFYLGGQDADRFLTELAQRLDCFPPSLLNKPFWHMEALLAANIDFETGGDAGRQTEKRLRRSLQEANGREDERKHDAKVNTWLLAGEYQLVLDWYSDLPSPSDEDRSFAAWAHVDLGNRDAADAAKFVESDLPTARQLWANAREHYAQALTLKPDKHAAANNLGNVLAAEARATAPSDLAEARRLWAAAGERYDQALTIKPDKHEAANNWGTALLVEARAVAPTDFADARRLWAAAGARYRQALAIKPDKHEAAYNWGNALETEARNVAPADLAEARHLWAIAAERYNQALSLQPDMYKAANTWSVMLVTQYHFLKPSLPNEAALLLDQAEELALRAESIRPGSAIYNLACIRSLKDDLPAALEGLRTAHTSGTLPPAPHLRADPDLAPLRADPAFQAWWREVFGPDEPLDAPAA